MANTGPSRVVLRRQKVLNGHENPSETTHCWCRAFRRPRPLYLRYF